MIDKLKVFVSRDTAHESIVFHCFSMNGSSLFSALWDVLSDSDDGQMVKQRIKGTIFDRFKFLQLLYFL